MFFFSTLYRRRSLIMLGAFLFMVAAASSVTFCKKKVQTLEDQWRSFLGLKELSGGISARSSLDLRFRDLTQYEVQVEVIRSFGSRIEIQLCDRYSFFLFEDHWPSGIYRKTENYPGECVSVAHYPRAYSPKELSFARAKSLDIRFLCDLKERTIRVYRDGKFKEKVRLDRQPVHCDPGLAIQRGRKDVMLDKLQILDGAGRPLFRVDFAFWSLVEFISYGFLVLGILVFLAGICSEHGFLRKVFLLVFLLLFLETFLRVAYPGHPVLDINHFRPKWRFDVSTDFYGAFDDPQAIRINSYAGGYRTYAASDREHTVKAVCIGSSPIAAITLPQERLFPALLEKKMDAWNGEHNTVMPLPLLWVENFDGVEPNIFLKEVVGHWHPDLVIYYGKLASLKDPYYRRSFERERALYHRAKRVMEKNADWIHSDRQLYAALEFKEPVKWVVYLYDFLCHSYVFMGLENARKRFFERSFLQNGKISGETAETFFDETLTLCRQKGVKVIFIPQLDFSTHMNDPQTENILVDVLKAHPEVHRLSLEKIFEGNKDFLLARDRSHPTEYGHQAMAEELFRQLEQKGLLGTNKAVQ